MLKWELSLFASLCQDYPACSWKASQKGRATTITKGLPCSCTRTWTCPANRAMTSLTTVSEHVSTEKCLRRFQIHLIHCHIVNKPSLYKRLAVGGNGTFSVTRVYPSALIFNSSGNRAISSFAAKPSIHRWKESCLYLHTPAYTCMYLHILVYTCIYLWFILALQEIWGWVWKAAQGAVVWDREAHWLSEALPLSGISDGLHQNIIFICI